MQKSKDFPESFFRVTIKGICRKEGKTLFIKRPNGSIELPGGGLEFGENIQHGLIREVKEELGLTVTHVGANPLHAWTWKFENKRELEWFYSLVLPYKIEIDFSIAQTEAKYRDYVFLSDDEIRAADFTGQTSPLRDNLAM